MMPKRALVWWLAIVLFGCSDRTIEPDQSCVEARVIPNHGVCMITRSGRVASWRANGVNVSQIEPDGTFTKVAELVTGSEYAFGCGWLEHDPESGRMWLLRGHDDLTETPASLYQFDAEGQIEWSRELIYGERPVWGGTLLYDDGALYVALTLDWGELDPADPSGSNVWPRLVLERLDLTGAVAWSNADVPTPDGDGAFASAQIIHVDGHALSMIATPPLIDWGPSYPLTVDTQTGEVLWSGADGHDGLRMLGDAQRLYLGWSRLQSSWLQVLTPLGVAEAPALELAWPDHSDPDVVIGWLGERIVSLVDDGPKLGVAVHTKDGTLECRGSIEADIEGLGWAAMGIAGRDQFVVEVQVPTGEDESSTRLLLVEARED